MVRGESRRASFRGGRYVRFGLGAGGVTNTESRRTLDSASRIATRKHPLLPSVIRLRFDREFQASVVVSVCELVVVGNEEEKGAGP